SARIRITSVVNKAISDTSDRTFSIVGATLTVTAPAAGAKWPIGSRQTITWTSNTLNQGTADIQLSRNGGASYQTIIADTANDGSVTWKVTGPAASHARIRVVLNQGGATGDSATFSITKKKKK